MKTKQSLKKKHFSKSSQRIMAAIWLLKHNCFFNGVKSNGKLAGHDMPFKYKSIGTCKNLFYISVSQSDSVIPTFSLKC